MVTPLIACTSPERRNKNCQWPREESRPLDLAARADQRHLDDDAQLADELATRYADYQHKIPYGYEGHGGLLEGGRVGRTCLATLDSIIGQKHRVTEEQIAEARRHRPPMFDAGVLLSFTIVCGLFAIAVCRALLRHVAAANRTLSAFAAVLLPLVMSATGIQLLDMWATTAEMIRIGNDHLGPRRAALIPWPHYYLELFVSGVVFFGAIVFAQRRRIASPVGDGTVPPQVLDLR